MKSLLRSPAIVAAVLIGSALGVNATAATKAPPPQTLSAGQLAQARKRRLHYAGGYSYSRTPYVTRGNRAQRRRQLEGMLARNRR